MRLPEVCRRAYFDDGFESGICDADCDFKCAVEAATHCALHKSPPPLRELSRFPSSSRGFYTRHKQSLVAFFCITSSCSAAFGNILSYMSATLFVIRAVLQLKPHGNMHWVNRESDAIG